MDKKSILNEFNLLSFAKKKDIITNLLLKVPKKSNLVNELLNDIFNFKNEGKPYILFDLYDFLLDFLIEIEFDLENQKKESFLNVKKYLIKLKEEEILDNQVNETNLDYLLKTT